jgi:alanine racemase
MPNPQYPNWIEINLSKIESNTRAVIRRTGVDVMGVVKTNAYGHGAVESARAVLRAGASYLAVVRLSELEELRQAGITAPVMVFGGALKSEVDRAIALEGTLPVYDAELAAYFSQRALALGRKLRVHLKVDTGLGRFGVFPDEALDFARSIASLEGLEMEGMMSHFSLIEEENGLSGDIQIERFRSAVDALAAAGIRPRWVHLAGSSGILHKPESYFNMVRAGGLLYGFNEANESLGDLFPELEPVFTWKTALVSVKRFPAGWTVGYGATYKAQQDEIIGVLNVGHGDGYRRKPGGSVLVEGQRVPIVGKICMDQMMVSLPRMLPLETEVVLVGRQGDAFIPAQELARRWEVITAAVTNVIKRTPRVYIRE